MRTERYSVTGLRWLVGLSRPGSDEAPCVVAVASAVAAWALCCGGGGTMGVFRPGLPGETAPLGVVAALELAEEPTRDDSPEEEPTAATGEGASAPLGAAPDPEGCGRMREADCGRGTRADEEGGRDDAAEVDTEAAAEEDAEEKRPSCSGCS